VPGLLFFLRSVPRPTRWRLASRAANPATVSVLQHLPSGPRHLVSGIRHPASGIGYPVSGIQYPVSGIWPPPPSSLLTSAWDGRRCASVARPGRSPALPDCAASLRGLGAGSIRGAHAPPRASDGASPSARERRASPPALGGAPPQVGRRCAGAASWPGRSPALPTAPPTRLRTATVPGSTESRPTRSCPGRDAARPYRIVPRRSAALAPTRFGERTRPRVPPTAPRRRHGSAVHPHRLWVARLRR